MSTGAFRVTVLAACLMSLGGFLACPLPKPPVNPPATCDAACLHADHICRGSGEPCLQLCPNEAPAYAACVMATSDAGDPCTALNACDPANGAAP